MRARRYRFAAIALILLVAACGENNTGERAATVKAGEVVADNVVIDDNGRARSAGPMAFALGEPDPQSGEMIYTGRVGNPMLLGPKIVYVFRAIPQEASARFAEQGLKISEHTAWLLPEKTQPDADAIRNATFLGKVDPTLSDEQVLALFGIGVESGEAKSASPKLDPEAQAQVDELDRMLALSRADLNDVSPDNPEYGQRQLEIAVMEAQKAQIIEASRNPAPATNRSVETIQREIDLFRNMADAHTADGEAELVNADETTIRDLERELAAAKASDPAAAAPSEKE